MLPYHRDVSPVKRMAKGNGLARRVAEGRVAIWIEQHLFNLFLRDSVLRDVLDIPVWIVRQISDNVSIVHGFMSLRSADAQH